MLRKHLYDDDAEGVDVGALVGVGGAVHQFWRGVFGCASLGKVVNKRISCGKTEVDDFHIVALVGEHYVFGF